MKGNVRYRPLRFTQNSSLFTSMRECRRREVIVLRKATWTEKGDVGDMAEEGSPPQLDQCQHLRDEIDRLFEEMNAQQELINSGELTPDLEEEVR
jgi:hypothetical protein